MSRAERMVALLVALALAVIGIALFLTWPVLTLAFDGHRHHSFYVASESMWPTLRLNDRILPRERSEGDLKRGTVVMVSTPGAPRLYRLVGLGGDRVEMRGGRLMLNGRAVAVRTLGGLFREERLPGEPRVHRIADEGPGPGDDLAPVVVPPGRLFVLGDNRDRAADSRYEAEMMGVGMVDARAVIGTVDVVLRRTGWRYHALPIEQAGAD